MKRLNTLAGRTISARPVGMRYRLLFGNEYWEVTCRGGRRIQPVFDADKANRLYRRLVRYFRKYRNLADLKNSRIGELKEPV